MDMKTNMPIWGAGLIVLATLVAAWLVSPALHRAPADKAPTDRFPNDEFPSTYKPLPSQPVIIKGATVLTGTDRELVNASVLLKDGRIAAIGAHVPEPPGARIIDGRGKFVTPGIIDIHSHLAVYPSPSHYAT